MLSPEEFLLALQEELLADAAADLDSIHTGYGENILETRGMIAENGWSISDYSSPTGHEELAILTIDEDFVSVWEVFSVVIENKHTKESIKIFRLEDGNENFNTFSSYEECEQELEENIGGVLSLEEIERRGLEEEAKAEREAAKFRI